jgi:hypothetical protein
VACDAHQPSIAFPLQADASDGAQTVLQPPAGPNAALDVGLPRLSVLCQAVFQAPAGSDAPFSLPAGNVTFAVSGPGLIVESAAQFATVSCGSAARNTPCSGATAVDAATVTGTAALSVHVVLLPSATLPPLPAAGAIGVSAVYQEDPALGDASATAQTAIDLALPLYAALGSVDQPLISSGPNAGAVVTVRLRHALPENCVPLGVGPYLFCSGASAQPGDAGAEAGTITFTTNLGVFPNGGSSIDAPCGTANGAPGGVVVPPPGVDSAYPFACTEASARLSAAGFAGEATVTATFTGALTGATAQTGVTLTIAPRPATLQLVGGCTPAQVPQSLPAGAPVADLVGSISPATAVVGIWRRDEAGGAWQALYLRGDQAPVDDATVEPGETISVCVDALAQYPLG